MTTEKQKLVLGVYGLGCVGYGLYEVLQKTPGLKASIKKFCVKDKNKPRLVPAEQITFDKYDILNDPEINVVVELIDDAEAAFEIVKEALSKGKAVVTANKKMIADHFNELLDLQIKHNVPLLYEGACCASIPIIRNLEEYYDNDLLESIEGIVNGSTNYILTKTFTENQSFEEALSDAKRLGYVETNPILDTGGFDAKYKLLILIAHAFGLVLKPDEIYNKGIQNLGNIELNYAREKNLKIKLVARAFKNPSGDISCFVLPQFIDAQNKLYTVDDVYNGVITKTCFADLQFFVGKGAGAHPTASAVLSDISALSYNYRYEYKKIQQHDTLTTEENILLKVMLRYDLPKEFDYEQFFTSVDEIYSNKTSGYIIGQINLNKLKEVQGKNVSVVLFEVVG